MPAPSLDVPRQGSKMPKVSALIPSRNRPELIRRAVQSVLKQTITDIEAIVVIDGPDPVTERVLAEIVDPRLHVLALNESVGASEARNRGAHCALGEWIAFLDDDDEWLPNKIEKQLAVAVNAKTRFSLVACSIILRAGAQDSVVPNRFPRDGEIISEYLFGAPRQGFQTSAFFCSRELMLAVPWRKLKGLQDIDWFLRAATRSDVTFSVIEEPLCVYWLESENNITSSLGWEPCLAWGRANRNLMSSKAYSFFLAKFCVHRATRQNAGFKVWLQILKDFLLRGTPTVKATAMFVGYSLVPYKGRRYLGNFIYNMQQRWKPQMPSG
jgi:glycosyltransferase involved in cell wall biosynthesis